MTQEPLKDYFERARRFDQDRLLTAYRSTRTAWSVAAVSAVLAACSVVAVAALAPLKSVEPFVIRVDNATGIVDVVSALTSEAGRYDGGRDQVLRRPLRPGARRLRGKRGRE